MKITLDTIAKHTGLSKSTVSRALAGEGNVKPQTRSIVEKAVLDLGYTNRHALRSEENPFGKTLLAISRDISQEPHVDYYHAISATMHKRGYITYLVDCNCDVKLEDYYVHYAVSHQFAGIFLFSHFGESNQSYLLADSSVPIILVNNYPLMEDLDVVCLDNYRSGYIATRYLLDHGHKKILYVGWPNASITSRDRGRGFEDAMKEAVPGFVVEDAILQVKLSYDSGYELGEQLAAGSREATALFFADSTVALGAIDALARSGIQVPKDVSIVAAGHIPTWHPGRPHLTVVGYRDEELGTSAAEMMLERIQKRYPINPRRRIVLSPALMEGDSVRSL